jgi:predicted DNA-binding ribbon-helix-helix protein
MKPKRDPFKKVPITVRLERRFVTHLRDEARRQRRTVTAVLTHCIEQTMTVKVTD